MKDQTEHHPQPDQSGLLKNVASITIEVGTLFGIATNAARDIKVVPDMFNPDPYRKGGQRGALVSIVFSVIAIEAFFNEIADYATRMGQGMTQAAPELLFSDVMSDAEEAHASLESKLTLAKWILSGKRVNRGDKVFQDFKLLVRLRNDLVHTKPNKPFVHGVTTNEEAHDDLIKKFGHKHVLANDMPSGSWTHLVQTKAVAEWCCRTAAAVISDFCSSVPDGEFAKAVRFFNDVFKSHIVVMEH